MSRIALLCAWLLLAMAICAVYSPGLEGPMVFDDLPNIVLNPALHIDDLRPASLYQAAMSGGSTEFGRPLTMLTFGINYALSDGHVYYYKAGNLALHVVNALLVGLFSFLLLRWQTAFAHVRERAPALAWVIAAAWGLHPLQVSTTLYVVQRMTELSALFTLAALIVYLWGRHRQAQGKRGAPAILLSLGLLTPLAFLSKETGVLVVAYVLVIELFASGPASATRATWLRPQILVTATLLLAAAAGAFLISRQSIFATGYYLKGFSVWERLMSEPRALMWYLRMLVFPDIGEMGLTHDDWPASRSLLDPPSTLFCGLAVLGLIAALPWLRSRRPDIGFCLAWFLAGHSLEAGPIPLDLVYEHRNYLPSLGIFIGAVCLAAQWFDQRGVRRGITAAAAGAVIVTLALVTAMRIFEWRNPLHWALAQTAHHPRSAFSFLDLGSVYGTAIEQTEDPAQKAELFEKADAAFAEGGRLNPRIVSGPTSRIMLRLRNGREVPQDLFDQLTGTLRTGPIPPSSQIVLMHLLECAINGECPLSATQLMSIVNAALENPRCPPYASSQLLVLAADYFGTREQDIRKALTLAKAASEVPGAAIEVRLTLVYWLMKGGYYAQAREALDEVDRLDRLNELQQLRQIVRQSLDAGNVPSKIAVPPVGAPVPR